MMSRRQEMESRQEIDGPQKRDEQRQGGMGEPQVETQTPAHLFKALGHTHPRIQTQHVSRRPNPAGLTAHSP